MGAPAKPAVVAACVDPISALTKLHVVILYGIPAITAAMANGDTCWKASIGNDAPANCMQRHVSSHADARSSQRQDLLDRKRSVAARSLLLVI